MNTLYLTAVWDLCADASGNIAMAADPYSLAQDAASAIKTFAGEVFYDTTQGIPYWTQVLGQMPPLSLVRAQMIDAAETVPEVASAAVYFTGMTGRWLAGQVQVTGPDGTVTAVGIGDTGITTYTGPTYTGPTNVVGGTLDASLPSDSALFAAMT